ncbi:MAG: threonine synthase [Candidatus Cloacimonetes bacterium]|nr:threonine synthase [Candidatus Cloacimonadota bacterium]MCF7814226.1 threonine synthase [Candidatus Cloacimonadota bacterium]MCF7868115.1 threonine synthase [Candidatus Cloacimonadota bacterium]MCF7883581.1 threonine synthase [Candidatus Cloacimonadota bacterium]
MSESIKFFSTNLKAPSVNFKKALLKGIAPDKGLYMPEEIPYINPKNVCEFSNMHYYEIAFEIGKRFLVGQIPDDDLLTIVKDAYNYEVPLENVYEKKYVMRLDQGPTASFKDFAARMMGRLMQYYLQQDNEELLILTATSGDTGSAIANAFYGLDNIKVVVLFPQDEVTARQRKQMTTLGKNIQILALDTKFDDCQALVKQAFADSELDYLKLSSANSINIGRLIPQIIYYFYSFAKLRKGNPEDQVVFSIPSGNFGDMMGGMLAGRMGLPISKYIIATNENDEFPKFVKTGNYDKIVPSLNCISSAMNVGHPSNLARLVALYDGVMDEAGIIHKKPDQKRIQDEIYSVSVSDAETKQMIANAWKEHKLLLEPHGSVGWAGLQKYLQENPEKDDPENLFVSLETAHPAKFPEQIREIIGIDPELPPSLEGIEEKDEQFDRIDNDYKAFKDYLIEKY